MMVLYMHNMHNTGEGPEQNSFGFVYEGQSKI